jgi:modulator of FtsH protease HflK
MADLTPPSDEIVPVEGAEPIAPRRGASAQFVVDSRPGEAAALREAMNPANQSLAEALRLTFRVLQVVIVVLVVLFLFSGFTSVQEGSTGVKTLFGQIHGAPGKEELTPGPILFWPYPAGETITFPLKQTVDLSNRYWPRLSDPTKRVDEAMENVTAGDGINPGVDGSLLTREGDIFHMKVAAEYVVRDAHKLVTKFRPDAADWLVSAAVQRGVVQTAAALTLPQLADFPQEPIEAIKATAQDTLNALECGIEITAITVPERTAPLAIRNAYIQVQQARENRTIMVEQARQDAEKTLNQIAGPRYAEYIALIDQYEDAQELGDQGAAEQILTQIGAAFESPDAAGNVAQIVNSAKSYRTSIQSTLGGDADRFQSLLPAWRENPSLVISQLWYDTLRSINARPDTEIISVPFDVQTFRWAFKTSRKIWDERRKTDLERQKLQADLQQGQDPYTLRAKDITSPGQPGRRLDPNAGSPQSN